MSRMLCSHCTGPEAEIGLGDCHLVIGHLLGIVRYCSHSVTRSLTCLTRRISGEVIPLCADFAMLFTDCDSLAELDGCLRCIGFASLRRAEAA